MSKINTPIEGWLQPDHVLAVLAALVGRGDAHERVHYSELHPAPLDGADQHEDGDGDTVVCLGWLIRWICVPVPIGRLSWLLRCTGMRGWDGVAIIRRVDGIDLWVGRMWLMGVGRWVPHMRLGWRSMIGYSLSGTCIVWV